MKPLEVFTRFRIGERDLHMLADEELNNFYFYAEQMLKVLQCDDVTPKLEGSLLTYGNIAVVVQRLEVETFPDEVEVKHLIEAKDVLSMLREIQRPDLDEAFKTVWQVVHSSFHVASTVIDKPPIIFTASPLLQIYHHDNINLVCLNNIAHCMNDGVDGTIVRLSWTLNSSDFKTYFADNLTYCKLRDVRAILTRVEARKLLADFDNNIFMTTPPNTCTYFDFIKLELVEDVDGFKVYEGAGFGENKFFVDVDQLAEHLDFDADTNAYVEACDSAGEAFCGLGVDICRLDKVELLLRFYTARLWNGRNERNETIERVWKFIYWFRDEFYPRFVKEHVDYWSNCPPDYSYYEVKAPDTPPTLTPYQNLQQLAAFAGVKESSLRQAVLDSFKEQCERDRIKLATALLETKVTANDN